MFSNKNTFRINQRKGLHQSEIIRQSHSPMPAVKNNPFEKLNLNSALGTQPTELVIKQTFNRKNAPVTTEKTKFPVPNNLTNSRTFAMSASPQRKDAPSPKIYSANLYSRDRKGNVFAYGLSSNQGIARPYNEDRVKVVEKFIGYTESSGTSKEKTTVPLYCQYFGVFDGHGGTLCSDFLMNELHHYVFEDPCFPDKPAIALKNAIL